MHRQYNDNALRNGGRMCKCKKKRKERHNIRDRHVVWKRNEEKGLQRRRGACKAVKAGGVCLWPGAVLIGPLRL